ncbi:MAG: 30S ribosomal protein S21 [Chloroflexota bacterium]|nr:MAG: 30S ribosomal protein S21 [Chloroflexota bacterium]
MQVAAREGESFEGLLKRFKSAMMLSGILQDYKRHATYVPPSEKRRRKAERARRRMTKKSRR